MDEMHFIWLKRGPVERTAEHSIKEIHVWELTQPLKLFQSFSIPESGFQRKHQKQMIRKTNILADIQMEHCVTALHWIRTQLCADT